MIFWEFRATFRNIIRCPEHQHNSRAPTKTGASITACFSSAQSYCTDNCVKTDEMIFLYIFLW